MPADFSPEANLWSIREYNAGLAIGTVTHSVLAELGRIESKVVKEANRDSTLVEIASQVYRIWVEAAENKINNSWRIFADAQISAQEGRHAVLENLRGFSHHIITVLRRFAGGGLRCYCVFHSFILRLIRCGTCFGSFHSVVSSVVTSTFGFKNGGVGVTSTPAVFRVVVHFLVPPHPRCLSPRFLRPRPVVSLVSIRSTPRT